ncbi:MAG TPA: hypothetical protein VFX03_11245 [Thermomicrobiales bacterium]|nr:hypothetical protein [Thermomicrobiales bacterium]
MATTDGASTANELREDIDKMKADLAALVETFGKLAADGGREGLRAFENVRSRAQTQATQSLESVEHQIAARPLTSVLIAFAAGMLFGKLMDRR